MGKGKNIVHAGILALSLLLYCVTTLEAATLSVGSGSGEPEDTVIIPISLSSSGGEEVCGFNLDLHFDTARLSFQGIALGEKAEAAGKSLSSSQPDEDVVRALVIGFNQDTIDDGTVLEVTFAITSNAPNGSATLTIANPGATDCEGVLLSVTTESGEIVVEGGSTETTTTTTVTSSTTTILECVTDAHCEDSLFCNGSETCVAGFCTLGDNPCPDDELFCNGVISCDEDNDRCVNSGDACPTDLICDEDNDVCLGCLEDLDCQDGIFCNGDESCDKDTNECKHSGNPCSEPTPLCDEDNDVCTVLSPGILLTPDFCYQSRWFPLLTFTKIEGTDTHFNRSSRVVITPADSLVKLHFVKDTETIFLVGIVFPSVVAPYNSVEVSIITDTEEVFGTLKLEVLSFLPGEG